MPGNTQEVPVVAAPAVSRHDAARWVRSALRDAVWMCRKAALAFALFSSAVVACVALAFHLDPSLAITAEALPIVCWFGVVGALFAWGVIWAIRGRFWF